MITIFLERDKIFFFCSKWYCTKLCIQNLNKENMNKFKIVIFLIDILMGLNKQANCMPDK